MFSKALAQILLVVLFFLTCSMAYANGLENRIGSVNQLLSVSSAAKKINSSSSQEAKAMLDEAKALHQQATKSLEAGDEASAKKQLSLATTTLFKAARLADGGKSAEAKNLKDYDKRKASVDAMLKQHHSIAEEKQVTASAQVIEAEVLSLVAQAESQAGSAEGLALLNQAYEEVKASLVKMRNGEQLVMSLDFATPQDEYQYYVKKITSQRRAIDVFSKRINRPNKRKMIDSILGKADSQQSQAETLAGQGQYADALPLMDGVLNKLRAGLMMVAR